MLTKLKADQKPLTPALSLRERAGVRAFLNKAAPLTRTALAQGFQPQPPFKPAPQTKSPGIRGFAFA
ncbi:hypothetical protein Pfra02_26000 [Pseudomonas fragi]|nr:hypothetical protein Pfra02_26000 [Pseudomonas fragi]